ncbi:thioredoxin domain-containing protein [Novosphingobium sp. FSY-8]|uniref:Thioredoxin domain-containing protein n=1 Tax=Novosphingobium ovatum TaxID=1908523 RepID=A0ABW9XBD6_9SPHN|nr:thioredoxin domain-containing protein [Novosphingobium ovatum]NBC35849.1 thioredoxin domain-containing protein [Novosphingobium ovatum]
MTDTARSNRLSRVLLGAMALPLALGLAACNKGGESATKADIPAGPIAPPAGKQWPDIVAANAEGGLLVGNPNAPIKLVEYASLSCPHCAKLAQDGMATLMEKYIKSGRVSLEFRSFAIHPQDIPLTVLARCGGDEAYIGLVEQVFGNFDAMNERFTKGIEAANAAQKLPPEQRYAALSEALGYTEFFSARGLPVDQQKKCLANLPALAEVAKHSENYSAAGINSTPTLFINGNKVDGAEWQALEAALKAAGA